MMSFVFILSRISSICEVDTGRLTRSGVKVATLDAGAGISGTGSTHFDVSGAGVVTVSATGEGNLSASYTLTVTGDATYDTLAITTVADAYDVWDDTEWSAVLAIHATNGNSELSGKAIRLHPISGSRYAIRTITNKDYGPAGLTIQRANTSESDPVGWPEVYSIILSGNAPGTSHVIIGGAANQGIRIHDPVVDGTNSRSGEAMVYLTGSWSDITVSHNYIYGILESDGIDPTLSSSFPTYPYAFRRDGSGVGSRSNLAIDSNKIVGFSNAVKIGTDGGYFRVRKNFMDLIYQDFISIGVDKNNLPAEVTIEGNVCTREFSDPADTGNPHSDFIQFTGDDLPTLAGGGTSSDWTTDDWENIRVRGNVHYTGNARGEAQGVFGDDMPITSLNGLDAYFDTMEVVGNLNVTAVTSHGISIGQAKNPLVALNLIGSYNYTDTSGAAVTIFPSGGATASGEALVYKNIAEAITDLDSPATTTKTSNVVLGKDGATIAYTTEFVSPSSNPTTLADVVVAFSAKAGSSSESNAVGPLESGYLTISQDVYGFVTATIDYTKAPTHFGDFTDQTGVALSSTITSNWRPVVGGGATTPISVTNGEYQVASDKAGSTIVTDWTSASGSVDLTSIGRWVRVRHTSSGSNSTATDTTLTIGGSPGSGGSAASKAQTFRSTTLA